MTGRTVEPYDHREYAYVGLPLPIQEALDMGFDHTHGRLFVWATSAAAAHRFVEPLGIVRFRSARHLKRATCKASKSLHRAYRWPAGTILASDPTGLINRVLRVEFTEGTSYTLHQVAELDFSRCGVNLADELSTEVTDEMVDVARNILADYDETMPIRTALAAALKVRTES